MGSGSRIQEAREARGLTKADLARLLGVSSTAVYNWESLDMRPRGQTLTNLCRTLGTSEEWILQGVMSPSRVDPPRKANDIINDAREALSQSLGVPTDRIKLRLELD